MSCPACKGQFLTPSHLEAQPPQAEEAVAPQIRIAPEGLSPGTFRRIVIKAGKADVGVRFGEAMPQVCVACGQPAEATELVRFSANADDGSDVLFQVMGWMFCGLLGAAAFGLANRKRRSLLLPVCGKHRGYRRRQAAEGWSAGLAVLSGVTALVLRTGSDRSELLTGIGLVLVLGGLGLLCARGPRWISIGAHKFHARGLTLRGVSPDFAQQYQSMHDAPTESYLRSLGQ